MQWFLHLKWFVLVCCLWQISIQFVFTDFIWERHTQAWFHLMETLNKLPAASSPAGQRRLRSHGITPGTGHQEWQSLQDAAGHATISSSIKFFSPHLYRAMGRGSTPFSLCPSHQLQPLPLILPFLQVGNLKAHSEVWDKVYWPITRQRHNSGQLGERLFLSF